MDGIRIEILNRERFVDNAFDIVNKLSNDKKSCTFAINGEWGSGKSFVLDMLEEKLSSWQSEETNDNQYMVFHYNCWKYDYYEEPLVAIVSAMYDEAERQLSFFSENVTSNVKSAWAAAKTSLTYIAGGISNSIFGVNVYDMKKEIQNAVVNKENKGYDENNSIQMIIKTTREKIYELTKDYTLVIFVDELDRCLPEYAIKVLERLHHLFDDLKNLIVILAVDKAQLEQTVSQIFGMVKRDKSKVDSYLRKFIDFELYLDKGIINENYKEKYTDYFSLFLRNESGEFDLDLFFEYLFSGVDIRSINRIIEKSELIHKLLFDEIVDWEIMIAELIWVTWTYLNKNDFIESVSVSGGLLPASSGYNKFNFSTQLIKYLKEDTHIFVGVDAVKDMIDETERTFSLSNESFRGKIALYLLSIYYNPDYKYRISKKLKDYEKINSNVEKIKKFTEYNYLIK